MSEAGTPPVIGIIGGSGLYEIDGLENVEWRAVESSFGPPSDALMFAELKGQKLVFLPRHGRGHRIPPFELNFRANIDALKRAGVTEILSLSAVGSLRKDLP
ncbi:MAG: S-methyl-5'-thioadenosine phosphorylase, partial [Pseudomonadota bacterium]|nr:S-methyl-5'-thioadenosine phosphorylase [Pseudomonadota bacterium]